jgi:hypothetical protein
MRDAGWGEGGRGGGRGLNDLLPLARMSIWGPFMTSNGVTVTKFNAHVNDGLRSGPTSYKVLITIIIVNLLVIKSVSFFFSSDPPPVLGEAEFKSRDEKNFT